MSDFAIIMLWIVGVFLASYIVVLVAWWLFWPREKKSEYSSAPAAYSRRYAVPAAPQPYPMLAPPMPQYYSPQLSAYQQHINGQQPIAFITAQPNVNRLGSSAVPYARALPQGHAQSTPRLAPPAAKHAQLASPASSTPDRLPYTKSGRIAESFPKPFGGFIPKTTWDDPDSYDDIN